MQNFLKESFSYILFLLIVGIMVMYWMGFFIPTSTTYTCDAENLVWHQRKKAFLSHSIPISGGDWRTKAEAHSGIYSIRTSKDSTYSFSLRIPIHTGTEKVKASVWRKTTDESAKHGALVMEVPGDIWKQADSTIATDPDGWTQTEISIKITPKSKNKYVKVFCWNKGKKPVYFDDIVVQISQ